MNLENPVNLNINYKPPNKLKLKTPGQKTQDRDTPLGCQKQENSLAMFIYNYAA